MTEQETNELNIYRMAHIRGMYNAWQVAMMVQTGDNVAASIKTLITGAVASYRKDESFTEAALLDLPAWVTAP